jgi:hypothetical protein
MISMEKNTNEAAVMNETISKLSAHPNMRFLFRRSIEIHGQPDNEKFFKSADKILAIKDEKSGAHVFDEVDLCNEKDEPIFTISRVKRIKP